MESLITECEKELELLYFKCKTCKKDCEFKKEIIELLDKCKYHKKIKEDQWIA